MKSLKDFNSILNTKKKLNKNSKSFFSSNQTIENNSKSKETKEKKINSNRNLINTQNQNQILLNFKTQTQSKDKKSKSKEKKKDIKYPNNYKPNLNINFYENIIDKFFLYLKRILPTEIYKEIKKNFIYLYSNEFNLNYMQTPININSSIIKEIKSNIILSYEKKNNNQQQQNFINNNMNNNLINNFNKFNKDNQKPHFSLYNLTKS
jgi:hypothetical protein